MWVEGVGGIKDLNVKGYYKLNKNLGIGDYLCDLEPKKGLSI